MKFSVLALRSGDYLNLSREAASRGGARAESAAGPAVIEAQGGFWVGLGDEIFVCAANGKWDALAGRLELAGAAGEIRKSDLHLVVQTGTSFQAAYPDTRVLAGKGRYLIVEFDREAARDLGDSHSPAFVIRPVPENVAIYAQHPRREPARLPAPEIAAAVAAVSRAGFETVVTHLVSYRTRHSTSADFRAAAAWAQSQFEALGLTCTTADVTVGSGTSLNVIATKAGNSPDAARGAVLVVAHLDSVNHGAGPTAAAPGADDNASGSAGVLTLAAAMAGQEFTHDLVFVLFGGEEQGLLGSTQYVAALSPTERARIRAVLNMDMIGRVNSPPPTVMLEGAPLSQGMIDALAQSAQAHTTLAIQTSLNPFASDHVPFIDAGIAAVLTIEGADSANDAVHSGQDTLDRLDMDYATQILRMNAGWLAAEAGIMATIQPSPQPSPQPGTLPVPPAHPGACGCGCGPCVGGPGIGGPAAQAALFHLNQVNGHYQALFAQYARINRDGRLDPADRAEWQSALLAFGQLDRKPR
jgi:Zn-dependent M28 family amino/carboxypeptidase